MNQRYKVIGASLACALGVACGGDDAELERGDVLLSWEVGASSCDERGLATIQVVLGATQDRDARATWQFPCADGQGLVPALEPGTYDFQIFGADAAGTRRYSARASGVPVRPNGETEAPTVVLRPEPGRVVFRWNFQGPLCGQVDVATVEVLVFDAFDAQQASESVPCETGTVELDLPAGSYDALVRALDPVGVRRDSKAFEFTLEPASELTFDAAFSVPLRP